MGFPDDAVLRKRSKAEEKKKYFNQKNDLGEDS